MNPKAFSSILFVGTVVILLLKAYCSSANGASPSIEQAFSIVPVQEGVIYSLPKPAGVSMCKIISKKFNNNVGRVVEGPDGVILRKLIDTNGDNKVNQWCFYLDGATVFRDIDSKSSGKADQFRLLNANGSRWGLVGNGDGKFDSWKMLSPEEATSEVVAALANRVSGRFASALLTPGELEALGLGDELTETINKRTDIEAK